MPWRRVAARRGAIRVVPGLAVLSLSMSTGFAEPLLPFGLEPLSSMQIADKKAGFTEPSGLVATPSSEGFWSVSDGTGALFRLTGSGEVVDRVDLGKHTGGLEGVAWDADRTRLLMVREDSAEILVIHPGEPTGLQRFALEGMEGFRAVATLFRADDNNGLEGITVVPETGTVIVVKENKPRLLLELTSDLTTIRGALLLSPEMGFETPEVADAELDVSGITYDEGRKMLWIASDTGRAVFLLDPQKKTADGFPLTWSEDGQIRRLKNAEGVALSADGQHLFVVTDDGHSSRLVEYEIH